MNDLIYPKAIDILTSQGHFHICLGLERVQKILDLMGNPQNKLKFVHVAGTNGKGSVCAMLSAVLKNAKCKMQNAKSTKPALLPSCPPSLRVGLFTSPHVFEYTERIKINDVEINKKVFAQKIIDIVKLAQKNDIHLTEFEILTVVASDYFAQENVDIVILETGLGGRLDATNVIENNICSVITHIDFDHTDRLGETIEKIAAEKAEIIKENCPVVISENNAGFDIIKKTAKEKNAEIIICKKVANNLLQMLSLKGDYQKENLALVLEAIKILNQNGFEITQQTIEYGLTNVKHPCRFEYLKEHNILIDGAHNLNGIKALRKSLDNTFPPLVTMRTTLAEDKTFTPPKKFKFIFGCLNNKDYPEMLKSLLTPKDEIYFYEFDNKNACTYSELASVCGIGRPFKEYKKDEKILTVICGSFYMIKELLPKMGIK